MLHPFIQDIRYAIRSLLRQRGFAIVAVVTLALGIGVNAGIFTIVNAVLLRPLDYKDPDRLVMIWNKHPAVMFDRFPTSPADFLDWKRQATSFESMSAFRNLNLTLTGSGDPVRLSATSITPNSFDVLGVPAKLGRTFNSQDGTPASAATVVLSEGLWKRRFASDTNIVGKEISLNGKPHTVVAVMPAGFQLPPSITFGGRLIDSNTDVWIADDRSSQQENRDSRGQMVIAKLKKGFTLAQAQAEMNSIAAELARKYPNADEGMTVTLISLQGQVVRNARPVLFMLLGAVGLVLLIACANVANLLLARATSRNRELAVRSAIGGTPLSIIRQLLTESAVLSLVGGLFGLVLSYWTVDGFVKAGFSAFPLLDRVAVDWRVLLFTIGVSLITGILFGVVPALQTRNIDINQALKSGQNSSSASHSRYAVRNAFVVSETALALLLLVLSGLFIQSLRRLERVDPGFRIDDLTTMQVSLPASANDDRGITQFFSAALDRIGSLPGVQAASMASIAPLSGSLSASNISAEGEQPPPKEEDRAVIRNVIGPSYFNTLGISHRSGRDFSASDTDGANRVVIISETLSRIYWHGANPIGRRMKVGSIEDQVPWLTVIGVVGEVHAWNLEGGSEPEIYLPHAQSPSPTMMFVLRSSVAPPSLIKDVRREIAAVDPNQPVFGLRTMNEMLGQAVGPQRYRTYLIAGFAALALLLTVIGIYGVMSFFVSERIKEIGIRMALGAHRNDVVGMVLRRGMTLALAGIAIGLLAAFAATRFITTLLFEVKPTDPATLIGVAILLAAFSLAATYVPARRATRVDPMIALRHE